MAKRDNNRNKQKSNDDERNGVGIFVSKKYKHTLKSWNLVFDRIIIARFRSNARHICIVQYYAPTEDLKSLLTRVEKGDNKTVMGDINAKLGPKNKSLEPIMGFETSCNRQYGERKNLNLIGLA